MNTLWILLIIHFSFFYNWHCFDRKKKIYVDHEHKSCDSHLHKTWCRTRLHEPECQWLSIETNTAVAHFTSHVTQRHVYQTIPSSPRPDSSSLSPFSHFPLTSVPTPVWTMPLHSVKLFIIPLSGHFLLIPWSIWLLCQYMFHVYFCLESLSSLGFVITHSLHNLLFCLLTRWLFFLDFPRMGISPFVAVNAVSFFDLFYLCTTSLNVLIWLVML